MTWLTIASAAISCLALSVSAIALWRTHFSPFTVVATFGPLRVGIHRMKNGNQSWRLPHVAISASFTNSGARLGRIMDIRITLRYVALPIADARETFRCHGEYDEKGYLEGHHKRFEMIKAKTGEFLPFVILPKSTVTKFYVFDRRWDTLVRQRAVEIDFEIRTDAGRGWTRLETWQVPHLGSAWWNEIESGGTFTIGVPGTESPVTHPADLHDHTLDEGLLGDERFDATPTTETTGTDDPS